MIEVTDEMVAAFNRATWGGPDEYEAGEPERAGLAAVLAIVQRDYNVQLRPDTRCARDGCGHVADWHKVGSCAGDLMFCRCTAFQAAAPAP